MKTLWLLIVMGLSVVAVLRIVEAQERRGPLTREKIEGAIVKRIGDSTLATEIRTHQLAFTPDDEFVKKLSDLGAGPLTIKEVKKLLPPPLPQIEMVNVSGGSFQMGSPDTEVDRDKDEARHSVTVPYFAIGKYEVTQAQWRAVMGTNPSHFEGDDLPVENVSWNDAKAFCSKLSQMTRKTYRLPTEAEWEYACRAGSDKPFAFGSSLSSAQANFDGNYPYGNAAIGIARGKTTPVGIFPPNGFGIYDMHGNVWEWCEDVYNERYDGAPTDGSAWLSGEDSTRHVLRGGYWGSKSRNCRSADRLGNGPAGDPDFYFVGFRVVLVTRN